MEEHNEKVLDCNFDFSVFFTSSFIRNRLLGRCQQTFYRIFPRTYSEEAMLTRVCSEYIATNIFYN